jgi:hypothetical protein
VVSIFIFDNYTCCYGIKAGVPTCYIADSTQQRFNKGTPMKLDRALQLEMLTALAATYPARADDLLPDGEPEEIGDKKIANLLYLEEHGLVEAGLTQFTDGNYGYSGARITAHGLDFLTDDGGLSAILGTVTVKFHDDTLKALIGKKIEESDLPPPEKKKWTDALRSLPADATKHLTMKLLDMGLAQAPDALHAIQTFLVR